MHLLVTGQTGQVATALAEACIGRGLKLTALGRPGLDLADPAGTRAAIVAARPDLVVNAAAWTAVDLAETHAEEAHRINADGAGAAAQAAADLGVPVIQLSTDYVFDGSKPDPYVEDDPTGPASVYGHSKLAGERAVAAATPDHAILRVAWVYAAHGKNFVRTMLRLAETRDEVSVVDDQFGNPTAADAIAEGILAVAANLLANRQARELRGVFHMTAEGEASWADLAEAIFADRQARGGAAVAVRRIPGSAYPTPARRPANSRLDCRRIAAVHGVRLPPWRQSLAHCLERLSRS